MGSAVVRQKQEKGVIDVLCTAVELGVNYFELAAGHAACFPAYGDVQTAVKLYLHIHFSTNYTTSEYGWTTDREAIKCSTD